MSIEQTKFPPASFFKRLAAIMYDLLVALAVAICAGMVITVMLIILLENGVLSMAGFEHTKDVIQQSRLYQSIIQAWTLTWVLGFFLWFWKNGGQTIGMRAWRLRIQSTNGKPITYARVLLRMVTSLFGIGTLLIIFNPKRRKALQDLATHTEIVQLSKEANHHKTWTSLS